MSAHRLLAAILAVVLVSAVPTTATTRELDECPISKIMGVRATTTADGVVRVAWPRGDVALAVDGLRTRPAMGLTSWAAFQDTTGGARVMGDTVVFEDEVDSAVDAALAAGIEITALHNHFFFDDPNVYFLHIGGRGSVEALARGVRQMWDAVKEVRRRNPQPADRFPGPTPDEGEIDASRLEQILGHGGRAEGEVFKVSIGRAAEMGGSEFGGSMGLTTWMAFTGGDELAAVAGDFAMTAEEVQPVLKALRKAKISIVALHNHMLGESPAIYFAHFWGKGSAVALAQGLRAALDEQAGADRASRIVVDFEGMVVDEAPSGFTCARTGRGSPGSWVIQNDPTAPAGGRALAQTSDDATSYRFPVCVYEGFTATDVDLSVAFKPVAGTVDQAAGLVWRYRDPENYYVVRANALEDNIVLYKVENGKRSDLRPVGSWPFAYGRGAEVPAGRWSTLRIVAKGRRFSVWLGDERLFDVEDDTFPNAGKVGVWTKADSVTLFDALRIETR